MRPDQETDLIGNIIKLVGRGHTGYSDNNRSVHLLCLYLFECQDAFQMNTNIRTIQIIRILDIRMRTLSGWHEFSSGFPEENPCHPKLRWGAYYTSKRKRSTVGKGKSKPQDSFKFVSFNPKTEFQLMWIHDLREKLFYQRNNAIFECLLFLSFRKKDL